MNVKEFCVEKFNDCYEETLNSLQVGSAEVRRREAQRAAIEQTAVLAAKRFPMSPPSEIWESIQNAYVHALCGVPHDLIKKVKSAESSWKSTSGRVFEELLKRLANPTLIKNDLELLMPGEVSELLKSSRLINGGPDLESISAWLAKQDFDLYLVMKDGRDRQVCGLVQAKTSLRERLGKDREPSINAMKQNFLSFGFVLNPKDLMTKKNRDGVNGGTADFDVNGWHAFYAFTRDVGLEKGRIHLIDFTMQSFARDAVVGAKKFKNERQWLKPSWSPRG